MQTPAKILIVDDNPVARLNLLYLLQGEGYTVEQASTGAEGSRLAAEWRPDMILLDVMLPDANGKELCRNWKADPAIAPVFVVLISSIDVSGEGQALGLDAGADGYIARPIGNRELRARVHSLIRLQQAEAALRRAQTELEQRVAERTAELSSANERLHTLSARLLEVQETERRLVARELHEEIGQLLTGLKLTLELAVDASNPEARPRLQESITLIDELTGRVSRLSLDLRPQMLDEFGLLPALEAHLKSFRESTGLQVAFQHAPMPQRLPSGLEIALFRIIQEALSNVARHAHTNQATVRIRRDERSCHVEVEDSGVGFDVPAALASRQSCGLAGMRERALLQGGELTLESAPGRGTRVIVKVPLARGSP